MKSLTKAKFAEWLKSKHPRTRVGNPSQCDSCPIAKFILQTTGKQCEVDTDIIYNRSDLRSLDTPRWVENFINRVDKSKSCSISSSRCLSYLREV